MSNAPLPAALMARATGLGVVSIVETEEIDSIKALWVASKQRPASECPFGNAVVSVGAVS